MRLTRTQRLLLARGAHEPPQESREVQIGRFVRDEIKRALRGFRQPEDGKDGEVGPQGERGPEGKPGRDGVDGRDGKPGKQGAKGAPGKNGKDGLNGVGIRDVLADGPTLTFQFTDGTSRAVDLSGLSPEVPAHVSRVEMDGNKIVAVYSDDRRETMGSLPKASTKQAGGGVSANRAKAISREIRFVTTTTDYTAKNEDDVIEADSSSGAITITIPDGRKTWLEVKRVGDNDVTVQAETAQIEDEDTRVLNLDLYSIRVAWNGTQYREF